MEHEILHNPIMINTFDSELWMPIIGWEGIYEISNYGRVKTVVRRANSSYGKRDTSVTKEKIREASSYVGGYALIRLCCRPRTETHLVHRLVALHFIDNPTNKPQVNHKDGNKLNNKEDNLEWLTPQENCIHAVVSGLRAAKSIRPKQDDNTVLAIFNSSKSLLELSVQYNIPKLTIQAIKSGKRYGSITGKHYSGRKY